MVMARVPVSEPSSVSRFHVLVVDEEVAAVVTGQGDGVVFGGEQRGFSEVDAFAW
jgi:hypothetical protein